MVKAFAYKNTMESLLNSSSGGAFWGIAEAFYKMGGGGIATEQNMTQILM